MVNVVCLFATEKDFVVGVRGFLCDVVCMDFITDYYTGVVCDIHLFCIICTKSSSSSSTAKDNISPFAFLSSILL